VIIPLLGLLAALSPVLSGGSLRRLAGLRFRATWVLVVALVAQVVAIEVVPGVDHGLLSAVHVATYVAAGWYVVLNRRIPGLWIVALGAASNGLAIAANGGTLPASRTALETAGIHVTPGEFLNSGVLDHPRLGFLGDVFAIPAAFPLANVFSVGDVLIVLGVAWGSHRVCGSRLVAPWCGPEHVTAVTLDTAPAPVADSLGAAT
jgi:Family of unknown function (DUF5317)